MTTKNKQDGDGDGALKNVRAYDNNESGREWDGMEWNGMEYILHLIHVERPQSQSPGLPCESACDPSLLFRADIHIFDDAGRTG